MRFGRVLWLRIAAVLVLIHGILHTIGGVFGGAAPGVQAEVVASMKANRFDAMGVSRTYWDFYFGYGLFVSVSFLLQAVVLWQLASLARRGTVGIRPILVTFATAYVAFAIVAWRYFFIAPVSVELLIAGCLVAAAVASGGERLPRSTDVAL